MEKAEKIKRMKKERQKQRKVARLAEEKERRMTDKKFQLAERLRKREEREVERGARREALNKLREEARSERLRIEEAEADAETAAAEAKGGASAAPVGGGGGGGGGGRGGGGGGASIPAYMAGTMSTIRKKDRQSRPGRDAARATAAPRPDTLSAKLSSGELVEDGGDGGDGGYGGDGDDREDRDGRRSAATEGAGGWNGDEGKEQEVVAVKGNIEKEGEGKREGKTEGDMEGKAEGETEGKTEAAVVVVDKTAIVELAAEDASSGVDRAPGWVRRADEATIRAAAGEKRRGENEGVINPHLTSVDARIRVLDDAIAQLDEAAANVEDEDDADADADADVDGDDDDDTAGVADATSSSSATDMDGGDRQGQGRLLRGAGDYTGSNSGPGFDDDGGGSLDLGGGGGSDGTNDTDGGTDSTDDAGDDLDMDMYDDTGGNSATVTHDDVPLRTSEGKDGTSGEGKGGDDGDAAVEDVADGGELGGRILTEEEVEEERVRVVEEEERFTAVDDAVDRLFAKAESMQAQTVDVDADTLIDQMGGKVEEQGDSGSGRGGGGERNGRACRVG
jgi:hypothetical protein